MSEFLKCFCIPEVLALVFSSIFFIAAYTFYRIIYFILQKLRAKGKIWPRFAAAVRYPILMLFMEIASLISLHILILPQAVERLVSHFLIVLLIGTLGWLAAAIIRAAYQNFVEKQSAFTTDVSRRSILTQVLFLYRFSIFLVVVISFAAILLTFPYIKSIGVGILGSAGIAGIALGIAARPILLNLMAGFQIALTKVIKIGDSVFIEGEFARVESIHLTHVVACTWDLRRLIVPIAYFIDKPFQNWDLGSLELLGTVFLYCDYTVSVAAIRKKTEELLKNNSNWNKKVWKVQVTNCSEHSIEVRILASANDAASSFDLRSYLREQLIDFLQKEYPQALPCIRNQQYIFEKNAKHVINGPIKVYT